MGNRGAAFGAEPAIDGVARVSNTLPLLDGALGLELVFRDDSYEGYSTKSKSQVSIKKRSPFISMAIDR